MNGLKEVLSVTHPLARCDRNLNSVSGRPANLIMISEEHWKNDEILFQNVYGHRESVFLRVQVMFNTYCFCDFLFHGYPCMKKENVIL